MRADAGIRANEGAKHLPNHRIDRVMAIYSERRCWLALRLVLHSYPSTGSTITVAPPKFSQLTPSHQVRHFCLLPTASFYDSPLGNPIWCLDSELITGSSLSIPNWPYLANFRVLCGRMLIPRLLIDYHLLDTKPEIPRRHIADVNPWR